MPKAKRLDLECAAEVNSTKNVGLLRNVCGSQAPRPPLCFFGEKLVLQRPGAESANGHLGLPQSLPCSIVRDPVSLMLRFRRAQATRHGVFKRGSLFQETNGHVRLSEDPEHGTLRFGYGITVAWRYACQQD